MSEPIDRYANSVRITLTVYDVTFEFSADTFTGAPTPPDQTAPLERTNLCRVRMSPQHAKAMAQLLTEHVAVYEKEFGKINLPTHRTKKNKPPRK